ncbi:YibE/F family protein [Sutcliffiella horikoshii]|uniref:YibE/F family protein n=1 Tax=Sutcliffiella horikoshii TaxID=79883 RepID=UPI002041420A|nr:YibE/F family protein [Sutcliffiella horikoshii]MCM3618182.1 YibE/F family protein [Sutcliffiella horikoshii]
MFKSKIQKNIFLYTILATCLFSSYLFVQNNHSFYDRPIAKVIETTLEDQSELVDMHNNEDVLYRQQIIAVLKNGKEKGNHISLINEYSNSGAYDQEYRVGNELFVSFQSSSAEDTTLRGTIEDVKRDKYLLLAAWFFVLVLILVGKRQGFYSIVSLLINASLLSYSLNVYMKSSNLSLVLVCGISAILFTVISLLLVNGRNEKSYAAVIATLMGTLALMLITYLVIGATSGSGLRYEDMQFLTRPPEVVFMAGILVGSLGAVMDIAITMSSSIFGLYEKKPDITVKALLESGMDIGKDIMGTMTNILFFAYVSGSIPILILYIMNASPFGYTLSLNLSLELARALAGGIGIVLTIPIGLYVSIFFVNRKRARA